MYLKCRYGKNYKVIFEKLFRLTLGILLKKAKARVFKLIFKCGKTSSIIKLKNIS